MGSESATNKSVAPSIDGEAAVKLGGADIVVAEIKEVVAAIGVVDGGAVEIAGGKIGVGSINKTVDGSRAGAFGDEFNSAISIRVDSDVAAATVSSLDEDSLTFDTESAGSRFDSGGSFTQIEVALVINN